MDSNPSQGDSSKKSLGKANPIHSTGWLMDDYGVRL